MVFSKKNGKDFVLSCFFAKKFEKNITESKKFLEENSDLKPKKGNIVNKLGGLKLMKNLGRKDLINIFIFKSYDLLNPGDSYASPDQGR